MRESVNFQNASNRLNFLQRLARIPYPDRKFPERIVIQLYRVIPNTESELDSQTESELDSQTELIAYVRFESKEEKDESGAVTKERTYRCFSVNGNTFFKNCEEGEVLTYTQIEERLLGTSIIETY